jgi:hypothetical protein
VNTISCWPLLDSKWRTGDALVDYRQHRPMVERSFAGSSPTATVESVTAASNATA